VDKDGQWAPARAGSAQVGQLATSTPLPGHAAGGGVGSAEVAGTRRTVAAAKQGRAGQRSGGGLPDHRRSGDPV